MSQRIEELRDELGAIDIWDGEYYRSDDPAFIEILAWKSRRQRAAEIRRELQLLGAGLPGPPEVAEGTNTRQETLDKHHSNGMELGNLRCPRSSRINDYEPGNLKTEQNGLLAMAVGQAGESIVITDAAGLITYVNPAFERITGYTLKELLGQHPRVLKSGAHSHSFYEAMWATLKKGETWRGHLINKRRDGTLFHEESSISPVVDKTGNVIGYVAVKRDITRETDLEQQFHAAQRMETIGQLAGGIAHDFNNLLAAILGNVELLEEAIGTNEKAGEKLTVVRQAARRATTLTRQLLAFSRRQALQPQVINLNGIVTETVTMLGRLLGGNIRVVSHLAPELANINADPGQLQQIILNLAVNARDAMPQGGTLSIETSNVVLTEKHMSRPAMIQPGEYVLLSVGDTGIGMTPEVQDRIFEPFYTTKSKGHGTGLGLATVYGIVKQSGGYIWVSSEVGKGSIFKVYLPQTKQISVPKEPPERPSTKQRVKLTGTALVVEDDPIIRELIRGFIAETGLSILEASSAEEALLSCLETGVAPRVLVTDHVLSGKDGVSLAIELRARFPLLKVILMSGYIEHGLPSPQVLKNARYLAKPFSRHRLQEEVMSLLQL